MPQVLLRHPNAVVLYRELIRCVAPYAAGLLDKANDDVSAGLRELDRVSHDVEKNLVKAQLVCDHVFVHHVLRIDKEVLVLCFDQALDHRAKVVQQVGDVDVGLLQLDRAAFYAAHVQDVVYQAQEMHARGADLAQVIPHLCLVVAMRLGQCREANNGVHGCADVVGHAV